MAHLDKVGLDLLNREWLGWLAGLEDPPDHDAIQACWAELVRYHAQPHRHYHTLAHIAEVAETLRLLDWWDDAVPLAAYFHDIVYDPRANDNEARSADLARVLLTPLGLEDYTIAETERLIRLTQTHQTGDDDESGWALLDADLAVLGADPPAYDRYAAEIRQEYAWVPEEDYRQGRLAVLERFLARPRIYGNEVLHPTHEEQARHNLGREIAALRAGTLLSGS
jgi:predicted metal-dependent HD superfamily phosphohydrolase